MTDDAHGDPLVTYETRDQVALIGLNRPEKRNAVNLELAAQLTQALVRLECDRSVRAAVLFGAGDSFCSGGDIQMFPALNSELGLHFVREIGVPIHQAMANSRKPIVAAVHGYCLAGGFEIALACSFIYAAEGSTFGMEEIRLGLIPGWGGTVRLARAVSTRLATEMLLSARRLSEWEALSVQIVNKVLPSPDECLDEAIATASKIASMPAHAVDLALDVIRAARRDDGSAFDVEQLATAALFGSKPTQDAVRAVLDRGIGKG